MDLTSFAMAAKLLAPWVSASARILSSSSPLKGLRFTRGSSVDSHLFLVGLGLRSGLRSAWEADVMGGSWVKVWSQRKTQVAAKG